MLEDAGLRSDRRGGVQDRRCRAIRLSPRRSRAPTCLTFTSASTVRGFCALLGGDAARPPTRRAGRASPASGRSPRRPRAMPGSASTSSRRRTRPRGCSTRSKLTSPANRDAGCDRRRPRGRGRWDRLSCRARSRPAARSPRSRSARSFSAAAGWPGAAVLFAFFLPSALLSRVGSDAQARARRRRKARAAGRLASARQRRRRGALRALGGARRRAVCSGVRRRVRGGVGRYVGNRDRHALAHARRSRFSRFRRVPAGLSGGDYAAWNAGQSSPARFASPLSPRSCTSRRCWRVAAGGIAGALADSILGASLQALRWCPACALRVRDAPSRMRHRDGDAPRLGMDRERRRELRRRRSAARSWRLLYAAA